MSLHDLLASYMKNDSKIGATSTVKDDVYGLEVIMLRRRQT
jgi:hypothetical protein